MSYLSTQSNETWINLNQKGDIMEELNFDGECTCGDIEWEADEDGFEGCPYCEMWDGDEVEQMWR